MAARPETTRNKTSKGELAAARVVLEATANAKGRVPPGPSASRERPGSRWIEIVAPPSDRVAALAEAEGIPVDLVRHALDLHERPRIQVLGEATLVVLRIPSNDAADVPLPYSTLPLGLILLHDRVAIVCARDNDVVHRLRAYAEREGAAGKHHLFVLHALELMAEGYQEYLSDIDRAVDALEERLQASLANREVHELLKYQKCLVHFTTALRATEFLLERIERTDALHIPAADRVLLEDVLVEVRQALDVATVSGNILGEMMDAFASIISNNLNGVMKFLAAIAVVLTVPITVASFYGMNVVLPGQHRPDAFAITLVASLVGSIAVALLMRRRGWW